MKKRISIFLISMTIIFGNNTAQAQANAAQKGYLLGLSTESVTIVALSIVAAAVGITLAVATANSSHNH